ncbi:MAG: peptidyl-prolyl cis-trans isomerase [Armatimonadetes bacterium]|nr:peptidyl-prolyl cis-trans isomerase [Armatimonadota bacterium]
MGITEQPGTGASSEIKERRAPARKAETPAPVRRTGSGKTVLWVVAALVVGVAVGVFGMRQRYKAQEVVVTVNGSPITKDQLFDRLQKTAGQDVMRAMVADRLATQYAEKQGLSPTDAEVEKRLEIEQKSEPKLAEILARRGLNLGDFKENLRLSMAKANVLTNGIKVSDSDVKAFYEKNIDKKNPNAAFYTPESVQIAVIVTKTEAEAKKAQADLSRNIPWPTVVKTYSQDNSKANDGVLPPTFRGRSRSSQIPGLEDLIFSMKIGEQVGPKQIVGAWWIIRCLDKKPAVTRSFADVKDDCLTGAALLKGGNANIKKRQTAFSEFQKNAKVQAFWPNYAEAVKVK